MSRAAPMPLRAMAEGWPVPLAALAALLGLIFGLGCWLSVVAPETAGGGGSLVDRMLGASRSAFSRHFYAQADRYFHGGVGHIQKRALDGVYVKWAQAITPERHTHAKGDSIDEIFPWLQFAIQMDPYYVEPYLIAAYLLRTRGQSAAALQVLTAAQRHAPEDYRIYEAKAGLLLRGGDRDAAARLLDSALATWPRGKDIDPEEATLDRARMLDLRGLLYEAAGNRDAAIEAYRAVLALFPDRTSLGATLMALANGQRPREVAARQLAVMMAAQDDDPLGQLCTREHADGDEHDHENDNDDDNEELDNDNENDNDNDHDDDHGNEPGSLAP